MQQNLSCYQLEIDCYKYRLFYVSLMVTTKQSPIVDTQKINIKESSVPLQKIIKAQMKRTREDKKNKGLTKQSENN